MTATVAPRLIDRGARSDTPPQARIERDARLYAILE
jgi:hypothetical protein